MTKTTLKSQNPKSRYQEVIESLDTDNALKLFKTMLLKPVLNKYTIDFYCSKHLYETTPSASYGIATKKWTCKVCEKRGYAVAGNMFDLIKLVYNFRTSTEAWDKMVSLAAFIKFYKEPKQEPKVLINSWGEECTEPTEEEYVEFGILLRGKITAEAFDARHS